MGTITHHTRITHITQTTQTHTHTQTPHAHTHARTHAHTRTPTHHKRHCGENISLHAKQAWRVMKCLQVPLMGVAAQRATLSGVNMNLDTCCVAVHPLTNRRGRRSVSCTL